VALLEKPHEGPGPLPTIVPAGTSDEDIERMQARGIVVFRESDPDIVEAFV
jgi:hypothetical protein